MSDERTSASEPTLKLRRNADLISVLVWAALGAVVIVDSMRLKYFSEYGPDAGFLPFWLGICLILGAIGILLETIFGGTATREFSIPDRQARISLLLVVAAMTVFILMIPILGFSVSTGVVFLFLLLVVEKRSWIFSLIAGLASTVAFFVIFEVLLGLFLPRGIFENIF